MRTRFLFFCGFLLCCEFQVPTEVLAVPDTTMTITPSATSGATITASDENTRNNNITTPYNAHSHTDIATTTANTYTVGNNAAGAKSFAVDNQFTTSPAIRYLDTSESWQFSNNATNFLNIVGTTSPSVQWGAGQVLIGQGSSFFPITAALTAGTNVTINSAPGAISIASSVTAKAGTFTRDTSLASGTQTITGLGSFTPKGCVFVALQRAGREASWGVDDTASAFGYGDDGGSTADTYADLTGSIIDMETGSGTSYAGSVSAAASGQFTITWTKTGSPTGTLTVDYICMG